MCVLLTVGAVAMGAGSSIMQMKEEEASQLAQQNALKLQETQQNAQAAQEGAARATKLQSVLSAQRAQAAAAGMSLSSGTFQAASTASYNNFAQVNQIANLNLSANDARINEEIDASQQKLHDQLIGNFLNIGGDALQLASFSKGFKQPSTDSMDSESPIATNDSMFGNVMQTYTPPGGGISEYLRQQASERYL